MKTIQRRIESGIWLVYFSHENTEGYFSYRVEKRDGAWALICSYPRFKSGIVGWFKTKKAAVAHAENRELVTSGKVKWRVGQ